MLYNECPYSLIPTLTFPDRLCNHLICGLQAKNVQIVISKNNAHGYVSDTYKNWASYFPMNLVVDSSNSSPYQNVAG